jgi:hypothetical protein
MTDEPDARVQERDNRIRERAYTIWERAGSPEGGEAEHWEQAIREIEEEDGGGSSAESKQSPGVI